MELYAGNIGLDKASVTRLIYGEDNRFISDDLLCILECSPAGVYINGKSRKINYAYNLGGMDQMRETVSDALGIPVDFTVEVNLKAFVKLVDEIGGVDFEVPLNMNYDDPYQDLHIHLKKGMQHLDGQNALKVVRFRHNNDGSGYGTEDIGRIGTQQAFLKVMYFYAFFFS